MTISYDRMMTDGDLCKIGCDLPKGNKVVPMGLNNPRTIIYYQQFVSLGLKSETDIVFEIPLRRSPFGEVG